MKPTLPQSPNRQFKRMERDITSAALMYKDVLVLAGPRLKTVPEGDKLMAHTRQESIQLFRTKNKVRLIRQGIKKKGWIQRELLPLFRSDPAIAKVLEERVKHFFQDAANTTAKADQILGGLPLDTCPPADGTSEVGSVDQLIVDTLASIDEFEEFEMETTVHYP